MPTEPKVVRLQFHPWDHKSTPPYTLVVVDGHLLTHYVTDLTLPEAANLFVLVGLPVAPGRASSVSDVYDAAVVGASQIRSPEPTWMGTAEGWAAVEDSGQLDPLQQAVWEATAHISGELILKGRQ